MLQSLVLTLRPGMEAALTVALLLGYLHILDRTELLSWAKRGITAALVLSVAVAFFLQRFGGREPYEGTVMLFATISCILLLAWMLMNNRRQVQNEHQATGAAGFLWGLAILLVVLTRGVDIALFPTNIFVPSAGYLNTELILKISGGVIGLLLAVVWGTTLSNTVKRATMPGILYLVTGVLLIHILRQTVVVVQILVVNGVLPMNDLLLEIIIPLINKDAWLSGALIALGSLAILITAFEARKRSTTQKAANPAQLRKLTARKLADMRWLKSSTVLLLLAVFLMLTGYVAANRKVELSPAVPVSVQDANISIPMDSVNDGQLHRFGYTTARGTTVRLIIIQKGGSAYGIGLDACEICGNAGYYQRGKSVVCTNCDVIINKATIGFKGGCNPVPLIYEMHSGNFVIAEEDLEKEAVRFEK
ncbi:MAG: Fe-S-containing protein [Bacillota bacterium]